MTIKPPPFDSELELALEAMPADRVASVSFSRIADVRVNTATSLSDYQGLLDGWGLVHDEFKIPSADGPPVVVSVFRRSAETTRGTGPGIYYIHGGGLVSGSRFSGLKFMLEWVHKFDAVLVSVEYRLAPEHPFPAAFDDCYAGLNWVIEQATTLGFDPAKLVIGGASAGGGLAAAVALRHRDEGRRSIAAQVLICPMLDDRNETVSSQQFDGRGIWDRGSNATGWAAYLGGAASEDVSYYAAPGRAPDLSSLPPAFLDTGSSEVFRDEIVSYASRIWAAGGQAELHVWPGGFHGFDMFASHAVLSRDSVETRTRWFRRIFEL